MAMLSGLLPSQTVLDSWTTVADAASWAGVDDGLIRSAMRQLGGPHLDSLAVLATMPTSTFEAALKTAVRGFRQLYEAEKARLLLMHGAVRAKFGGVTPAAESQVTHSSPLRHPFYHEHFDENQDQTQPGDRPRL